MRGESRGSWIRTNDLQYPKLPRYQAALYPECVQQAPSIHASRTAIKAAIDGRLGSLFAAEQRMRHAIEIGRAHV